MEGTCSYGGDVAEIYMYQALPYQPSALEYVRSGGGPSLSLLKEDFEQTYGAAWEGIKQLALLFQENREATLLFSVTQHPKGQGDDIETEWIPAKLITGIPTVHRFYVKASR